MGLGLGGFDGIAGSRGAQERGSSVDEDFESVGA